MSKLSEFGTHIKPDANSITQFEEHWTYTKAERRELVTKAIYEFIIQHLEGYTAMDSLGNCMKEFLEEQGI